MPMYKFRCTNLEKPDCKFEFFGLIFNKKEIEDLICPECKGKPVIQIFAGIGAIVFKGQGWTPRNPNDKNYDTTSGIRDQVKELKGQIKDHTTESLYGKQ